MTRRFNLGTFTLAAMMVLAVALAVPAAAQGMAVVPTRVIYPGETITAENLEEIILRQPPRGATVIARSMEELDGKVARRTLLPGRLVSPSFVRDAYLVETGSPVTVHFTQGALRISSRAVPLQAGAAGDLIKLRNIDSGRVFMGIVMADGSIEVSST